MAIKPIIEQRIEPLVTILNEVPFIITISSCEGHYNQKDYRKYSANVIFETTQKTAKNLEELIQSVYSRTTKHRDIGSVNFYNRHYSVSGYSRLFKQGIVEISPFGISWAAEKKRKATDNLISLTVKGVEDYIKKSNKIRRSLHKKD